MKKINPEIKNPLIKANFFKKEKKIENAIIDKGVKIKFGEVKANVIKDKKPEADK